MSSLFFPFLPPDLCFFSILAWEPQLYCQVQDFFHRTLSIPCFAFYILAYKWELLSLVLLYFNLFCVCTVNSLLHYHAPFFILLSSIFMSLTSLCTISHKTKPIALFFIMNEGIFFLISTSLAIYDLLAFWFVVVVVLLFSIRVTIILTCISLIISK